MTPRDPELHITVVAFTAGKGLEMRDEIALCKAALLYADRVTLASPKAAMLEAVSMYRGASGERRSELLIKLAAQFPEAAAIAPIWSALRRKKHKTRDELIQLAKLESRLGRTADAFDEKIEDMLDTSGARELEGARAAGILELDALGTNMDSAFVGSIAAALGNASGQFAEPASHLVRVVESVLGPESATYPMFSELTGGLARAMVKEGKIAGAELAPATQAGVAGRFISALDAFPDAPIDVVLDARGKLHGPLRRFRGGVTRLSRELSAGGIDALDPRFQRAADELYREHVAPALQEIEELSQEMGLRNALLRSSPKAARDVALATMALVATTGGGVGELATLAAGAAGDLVGRTAIRQRDLRTERDKNEFVFLYEADKRLA